MICEIYDDKFDAFASLIASAFACDATRVVTFSLGCMPTSDFGWDGYSDDVHKGFAHNVYDDPESLQAMIDYQSKHSTQVARLIALLESIPDIDGRSIMDNTLIVWGSELADGWHGFWRYSPVIIGGDWYFQTGRYMHWKHQTPIQMLVPANISSSGWTSVSGKPHQHLLVSVAQAMGLDCDQVGIGRVQSQSGETVDCRGPLPGLTF